MKYRNTLAIAFFAVLALLWLFAKPATESLAPAAPPVTAEAASKRSNDARWLPAEAWQTIALIQRGGPYPHRQDGTTFGNRERLLPAKPRGWYREYTVETPGLGHRGKRRIVTGGQPPEVWYYTDDHYQSFRQFTP